MSCYRFFAGMGALAGLGFGIYAATQNFNPEANQADSMNESTRFFSELLMQTANVALQSGTLSFFVGAVGGVLDCITCGKFLNDADKDRFSLPQ